MDGDIKRSSQKIDNLKTVEIRKIMIKNPISVNRETLAAEALSIMTLKKVTSLCVHDRNKRKTIGIIHIHNILQSNI